MANSRQTIMLRVFKGTTRVDCKSAESLKGYAMSSTSSGKASETSPPVPPHSPVARVFHWGFVFVLAYGLAKQVDELEELNDRGLLIEEVVFAIVFLGTLLARFVYVRKTRPTALPSSTGKNYCHRGQIRSTRHVPEPLDACGDRIDDWWNVCFRNPRRDRTCERTLGA